jgi:pyruvate/2-oxoglutarate dehydrogenase complex dihydrolipoamide acyltransferase (E2) component
VTKANPTTWTASDYERAAEEYLASLPLEHFMEGRLQAKQREITLASLNLLKVWRVHLQVCNELLMQYFFEGNLRQVVSDNMALESDQPIQGIGSFAVELEPTPPFLVLEYVSPGAANQRKDYEDCFRKYERELKVPYCLLFDPGRRDLRLYRHTGKRYELVPANAQGRHPIPEWELEVGLLEGWVRFWYQGRLLELPADLQRGIEELQRQVEQQRQRAEEADRRAEQEKQRAEHEKQRAEQEQQRAEHEQQRAEQEQQRAEHEKQRATQAARQAEEQRQRAEQADRRAAEEQQRAEQAARQANEERQRAEEAARQTEQEKQQRTAAEAELARLRARLEQMQQPKQESP